MYVHVFHEPGNSTKGHEEGQAVEEDLIAVGDITYPAYNGTDDERHIALNEHEQSIAGGESVED